ncbi:MAG: hypothetical protein QOC59_1185 [Microbacteriaceae bacterium]|nr:hypothetical protein [Microbacteriaceae bacterium]
MKLYAESPAVRTRQIALDAGMAIWIVAWVKVGQAVYRAVERLRGAGRTMEEAGHGFADKLDGVARTISRTPVVGDRLREPFTGAADAGRTLQRAGVAQNHATHAVALWLGILLALIPILYLLVRWLPSRVRWIREATAVAGLRIDTPDLELFALRAVVRRPLWELRRACADPAAALAARDFEPLARLELAALGLRTQVAGTAPPS